MNAAETFVAGRGAIPIQEVGKFLARGHGWLYAAIGRGELRQIGSGRITADSLVEFYRRYEKTQSQEVPGESHLGL